MTFNTELWNTQTPGAGGYEIERSLRFNSSDSAYLSKNFGSAGNRTTFTFSCWVKLTTFGSDQTIFAGWDGSTSNQFEIRLQSDNTFFLNTGGNSGNRTIATTSAVFRDPSAWYHLVCAVDTTQASASNHFKFYINNSLQTLSLTASGPQNLTTQINGTFLHHVGVARALARYFNGYLADVHFIDGQALDPTSFGEFDDNGVWQPIEYSGSYNVGVGAVNGFHLDFADNSSAAALGTDTSGAGNTWTVNNLSIGGIAYSSYGSGTVSGTRTFDKAFDGSTSTFCEPADNQTITFDFTSLPGGGIAVSSSLRMYLNKAGTPAAADFTVNGTNLGGSLPSGNWLTISGVSSLQTITFFHNSGTSSVELYAVEVDGTTLVDGSPAGNDSLVDSPTNYGTDSGAGGEVRGNYCTWNPLAKGANVSLSNGNLDASTSTTSGYGTVLGTVGMSSGKWYWEFTGGTGTLGVGLGIAEGSKNLATYLGTDVGYEYYSENGNKYSSAGGAAYGSSWGSGDVIGVTFDADAGTLSFYKNGVSQGTAYTGLTNTPYFPAVADSSGANVLNGFVNFGQRPFAYTAPSGFKALCTTNLPEPTIADGSTVMDVKLYTGDGNSTRTISGLGFEPDLVWLKDRNNSGGDYSHRLHNSVVGAGFSLSTNSGDGDRDSSAQSGGGLETFTSTGFTLEAGTNNNNNANNNNTPYVAWTWDAGSSTVTNNDGSITSQVRANPGAGFSVVTYTVDAGNNNSGTFGHGLGVVPRLMLRKYRNGAANWQVETNVIDGSWDRLDPPSTSSKSDISPTWPATSTTMTNAWGTNSQLVVYCFAPVAGYSSFGSYIANGLLDGPFVYTGFRPRWILIKGGTHSGAGWAIYDTVRDTYNITQQYLNATSPNAEVAVPAMDTLSNGFKIRSTNATFNSGTYTYIYAAFAEHPFATSRAR